MKSIYSIIISMLLLAACSSGGSVLDNVEDVIEDNPDSAQKLLNSIENPFTLSNYNHARYALLRTWADDLQDKGVGSDTIIRYAYNYFDEESKHGDTSDSTLLSGFARSCYFMARFYASVDSTKQSETYYRKAIECAEKCKDFRTAYLAYDYLSYHVVWSDFKEGLELSLKALDTYNKYKKKKVENEIAIRTNIATNYAFCNDSANAFDQLGICLKLAKRNKLPDQESYVLRAYGSVYYLMGIYSKSISYLKESTANMPAKDMNALNSLLASVYLACDSIEKAKSLIMSFPPSEDNKEQYAYNKEMYDISMKEGDYDAAKEYGEHAFTSHDGMLFDALSLKQSYLNDVVEKEKENFQLEHQQQILKSRWITIVVILSIILVFCFVYMRNRIKLISQKKLNELRELKLRLDEQFNKEEELQALLQQQQDVALQRETKYKEEVQLLTDCLCKIQDGNSVKNTASEFILSIRKKLENKREEYESGVQKQNEIFNYIQNILNLDLKDRDELFRNKEYMLQFILKNTGFHDKIQHGQNYQHVTPADWEEIEGVVNYFFNNMIQRLREQYPQISDESVHLCIMNRLKMSRKQIADFYLITEEAVKKRNQKLKRSIFGIMDPQISLLKILESI